MNKKTALIILFSLCFFLCKAQKLDAKTEAEIHAFIKKEAKSLRQLKLQKYYGRFYNGDEFVNMFEDEKINRSRRVSRRSMRLRKKALKLKKEEDYFSFERVMATPFKQFYKDFNLLIFTKEDIEKGYNKTNNHKKMRQAVIEKWNPKIELTENRYFVCFIPKEDSPRKYGDFIILHILEKKGNKWGVYSAWN